MSTESTLLCTSIYALIYLLTIIIPTYVTKYFELLGNIFLKKKQKEKKEELHTINTIYTLLLLFPPIWKTFVLCYEKFSPYNKLVFGGKHEILYQFGIAFFFFLLGLLFSKGKKILTIIINHPIYILKTLSLTMMSSLLLMITKNCIKELLIIIALIKLIYLLNYYQTFKIKKENMKKYEFIYHFSWLLIINFLNSFILVFNILNQ